MYSTVLKKETSSVYHLDETLPTPSKFKTLEFSLCNAVYRFLVCCEQMEGVVWY